MMEAPTPAPPAPVAAARDRPMLELHPTAVEALSAHYHYDHGTASVAEWRRVLAVPPSVTSIRVNRLRTDVESARRKLADHLRGTRAEGDSEEERTAQPAVQIEPHPVLDDGPHERSLRYPPVIVDRGCAEAVLRGAHIYAAGVIAAAHDLHKGDMVSVLVDDGTGGKTGKLTRGEFISEAGDRTFVGNGQLTMARTKPNLQCDIRRSDPNERIYETPSLNGVMEDLLFLQNIPSIVVGHLLDPQPGELILDMCSAPGGKTTHIAALAQDKARIFALDKNEGKVEGVRKLCQRLGVTSVTALALDATKAMLSEDEKVDQLPEQKRARHNPTPEDKPAGTIKGWPPSTFDRILLDPPCSGLGNRPRLKDTQSWKALQNHAAYQRKLIHTAIPLLKPGGTLVYSTCTINPLENEENVAFILQTFPQMKLVEQIPTLGLPGLATTSLPEAERRLVQRFDPVVDSTVTGFFIAKFVKEK